jgi:hypothetical protein
MPDAPYIKTVYACFPQLENLHNPSNMTSTPLQGTTSQPIPKLTKPTAVWEPYTPQDSALAYDRLRCAILNVLKHENLTAIKHSSDPLFPESDPGKLFFTVSFKKSDPVEAALFSQSGLDTIPNLTHLFFRISTGKALEATKTVYRVNAVAVAYDQDIRIIIAPDADGIRKQLTAKITFKWWVPTVCEDIGPSLVWKEAVGILQHWIKIGYGKDGRMLQYSEVEAFELNPNPLLHLGLRGWPAVGNAIGPSFKRVEI